MTSTDRNAILVMALALTATAVVGMALGSVLTLWAVGPPMPAVLPLPTAVATASLPEPPPPAPMREPPAPSPSVVAPPAAPAPLTTPGAAASTPVPVAADATPADAGTVAATLPYAVQFGAFAEMDRAQHLADALKDRGYAARIEDGRKSTAHGLHFVRLADGYRTKAEALQEVATLKRELDIDTIPVRRDSAEPAP
jgi:cell division septation protein DedD